VASDDGDSVERMLQINEKLKAELSDVISKMENQMNKFQEKRVQKLQEDRETNEVLNLKNNKIKKGQNKFQHLKKEIADMWNQLEHSYNIEMITNMENDLKDKSNLL